MRNSFFFVCLKTQFFKHFGAKIQIFIIFFFTYNGYFSWNHISRIWNIGTKNGTLPRCDNIVQNTSCFFAPSVFVIFANANYDAHTNLAKKKVFQIEFFAFLFLSYSKKNDCIFWSTTNEFKNCWMGRNLNWVAIFR